MLLAVLGACLLVWGCASGSGQSEQAPAAGSSVNEDRRAVIDAHLAMLRAYEEGDVEAFVAGLDPSPELLIFHPRQRSRFTGVDEIRHGMERMFAVIGGANWSDVHQVVVVEGDVAWLTAQIILESPNLDPPFVGRSTEIYVRRAEGWRLAHAHWSASPE